MLTYVFLFIAAFILVFQGAQLAGEIKNPLGVVPDEVALPESAARRWGERLIVIGCLTMLLGFLGFLYPYLEQFFIPAMIVDGCAIAVFALYLIFAAPRVQFIGKPSGDEHH
ncbi:MAG: hypothetical protein LBQ86_00405 [Holophagales bacterium]|jgi:cyanate permease|nr:hypothetical protein [Holophagales bacterium]